MGVGVATHSIVSPESSGVLPTEFDLKNSNRCLPPNVSALKGGVCTLTSQCEMTVAEADAGGPVLI